VNPLEVISRRGSRQAAQRRRRRGLLIGSGFAAAVAEGGLTWIRSGRVGGNLVVRCSQGHLFTTLWIPAASLKALRLGWWRVQYCPVARHWSVVVPVRESDLTDEQRRIAAAHHDIPIP
jgi:hypothetical protein